MSWLCSLSAALWPWYQPGGLLGALLQPQATSSSSKFPRVLCAKAFQTAVMRGVHTLLLYVEGSCWVCSTQKFPLAQQFPFRAGFMLPTSLPSGKCCCSTSQRGMSNSTGSQDSDSFSNSSMFRISLMPQHFYFLLANQTVQTNPFHTLLCAHRSCCTAAFTTTDRKMR